MNKKDAFKLSAPELEKFVDALHGSSNTTDDILKTVYRQFKSLGATSQLFVPFPSIDGHTPESKLKVYASDMDENVLGAFNGSYKVANNPIMQFVMLKGRAMWFSDMRHEPALKDPNIQLRFDWLETFYGEGLSVPFYGPSRRAGYATLGFNCPKRRSSKTFATQISWLCSYAYHQYCATIRDGVLKVQLTKREVEVTRLLAQGKTNPEIANALSIKQNTVSTYVKRIFAKLETTNRVTAVLRAYSLELIN